MRWIKNIWQSQSVDSLQQEKRPVDSQSKSAARASWDAAENAGFLPDFEKSPIRPSGNSKQAEVFGLHPSMLPRPRLSVVLGSLNRRALLELAVNSIRTSNLPVAPEIIVVDGGSSDGSLDWLVAQDDVITIVQHNRVTVSGEARRRRSWGGFMNIGFKAAGGDLIAMISDDCLLLPDALQAAVDRIDEASAAGLPVGACAFYFRNWPDEDRYYVQRTIGGNLMVNHGIYTRAALEAVGYADEDRYVFYKADSDLSLEMWNAGYCIIDSPLSICEHFMGVGEAIRETNNAVMDFDRKRMTEIWSNLTVREGVQKMGKHYLPLAPGETAEKAWQVLYQESAGALQLSEPKVARARHKRSNRKTPAPSHAEAGRSASDQAVAGTPKVSQKGPGGKKRTAPKKPGIRTAKTTSKVTPARRKTPHRTPAASSRDE